MSEKNRGISRRDFLKLMTGAAGVGALAACGVKPTEAPAPTAVPVEPTAAPVIKNLPGANVIPKAASGGFSGEFTYAANAGPEADAHTRNITKFNEVAEPLKGRIEEVGRDVWQGKFTTNFQSQSDAWDALACQSSKFQQAAPAGWLAPVQDFLNDSELVNASQFDVNDWPEAIRNLFTFNGKLHAFPQEASANIFFYRKDLVDKWGLEHPPAEGFTWDALIANARTAVAAIKAEGLEGTTYPLIMPVGLEQIGIFFMQTMWSYGGQVYKDDKIPNYNSAEGKQVLADMKSWYDEGLMSPGATGFGYSEIQTAMQQGGGIYMTQWNASAPTLLNAEKSPVTAGNMAFSIWPYHKDAGPGVLRHWPSVWSTTISAYSKKQKEAFSYIAWFTSKEIARDYVMNGGGSSGRTSLLTDPEVLAKNPQFGAMGKGMANYHALPNLMSESYVRSEILSRWLHSAMTEQVGLEEALNNATTEATNYLKDQGEI
jgi:ABC-type glycerol-3-phosphate transport system substrate-binding protein